MRYIANIALIAGLVTSPVAVASPEQYQQLVAQYEQLNALRLELDQMSLLPGPTGQQGPVGPVGPPGGDGTSGEPMSPEQIAEAYAELRQRETWVGDIENAGRVMIERLDQTELLLDTIESELDALADN